MRSYAIGDIHGQLEKLQQAHNLIATDMTVVGDHTAPVVHVGDLVDRGPDSRGVIDFLIAGMAAHPNWITLKGNHDRMFAGFMADMSYADPGLRSDLGWLHPKLGGATTLASYGVNNAADRPIAPVWDAAQALVPQAHLAFLRGLPAIFQYDQCAFVHAGIAPGIPLDRQTEDTLVWIRQPFLNDLRDHGRLIVHGHTVVDHATHYRNRLNIDSGAAYGGPLSAVVIEGQEAWLLTPEGRKPLLPS